MIKYQQGGSVPRETVINGQRHSLAYINPFEEDLLNTQYRGGEGNYVPPFMGPGGVPAYIPGYGSEDDDPGSSAKGGSQGGTSNYSTSTQLTPTSLPPTRDDRPRPRPVFDPTKEDDSGNGGASTKVVTPVTSASSAAPRTPDVRPRPRPEPEPPKTGLAGILEAGQKMFSGIPSPLKLAGAAAKDLGMGLRAGFGDRESQIEKLTKAVDSDGNRMYTDFDIDDYFISTDAGIAQQKLDARYRMDNNDNDQMTATPGDVSPADPCPPGYVYDDEKLMCVMDPDADPVGAGGVDYTIPDPMAVSPGGNPGYTQPVGNFIPTPLQPTPMNPIQMQLNQLAGSMRGPQQPPPQRSGLSGAKTGIMQVRP